jgi:hypothetical protein
MARIVRHIQSWVKQIRPMYGRTLRHVGRTGFEPVTSSVSGNAICRSCFRILTLNFYVRSTLVRWCPSPSAAIVTQLVTRLRPGFDLAFWMQTTGTTLLAAERCSLARVRMPAQDSRSVRGLLYLAAVSDEWREQEHRQGIIDVDPVRSAVLIYAETILTLSDFPVTYRRGCHG